MPKISFVMPTYNRSGIIRESIKTIIDQSISDWELIIVDDHSEEKDNTEKVVNSFRDSRIKYHKLPDLKGRGVACARNYGNAMAESELIAVCDSDDLYLPEWGRYIYDTYKEEGWDVFYGKYVVLRPDGTEETSKSIQIKFDLKEYKKRNFVPNVGSSYTKKIAMHYPYNSYLNWGEDRDMFSRLAADKKKFYFCDKVLFKYRVHGQSITQGEINEEVEKFILDNRGWIN